MIEDNYCFSDTQVLAASLCKENYCPTSGLNNNSLHSRLKL